MDTAQFTVIAVSFTAFAASFGALFVEAHDVTKIELRCHRHQKLLNALYILDVGEAAYNRAMEQDTMQDRAWALAEAIYDRETEKIKMRQKYSRESGASRLEEGR